ncbi:antitoxin [Streptomyces sp. SID3343]|nr:antitoxin [Streptomyces sp. SID3343]MYW05846.1 antitoxin [Streptomyces sp. SID3343]
MGVFDNLKAKAEGLLGQHGDKADKGIDKAADIADTKTGGKHTDKIRSASDKAKEGLGKAGDKGPGPDAAPQAAPPTQPPADPTA